LAPDLARFGHFCLDQKTAQTLQHVAISVLMNEPCLLEGETSTSKTSTIEYLAALLGQPLVRINLNGQTDTGELLGRFVPNDTASGSKIPAASLALRPDLLDARSAEIVQRAVAEHRELSEREREKVAALEGIPMAAWRWQDGLVIQALRNGWWLLLDEVNLAEAQILERLNSLLEAHPSLVLTEHGNEVFGDKGTPIHPSFRIFGTMNPAEYAGRSVLSPAYKDRWRGFRQVPGPSEPEYLAMLMLMVFGIQPSITLDNTVYPGSSIVPSHPGLDTLSDITEELKALARFHASMESAAGEGSGQLGLRRKERPVFTRRSLLSVLDYIGRVACPEPGTSAGPLLKLAATRYYMDRVAGTDDRQVVSKLLEASGLGMGVQA
jgi:MoxR-like ATPase